VKKFIWCLLLVVICCGQQCVSEVLNFVPYNLVEKNFPDFTFLDDQNNVYSSKNLIGKWHLLCFLPKESSEQVSLCHIKDMYEWLNNQNVAIVCVSSLHCDEIKALRLKYDLPPFTLLSDYGGEKMHLFTGETICCYNTIFLIDEQGIVREVINSWSRDNIAEALTFFMKKQLHEQKAPSDVAAPCIEQTRRIDSIPATPFDLTGREAPLFQLSDEHGILHSLTDYQGKWCILLFLPDDSEYYKFSRYFNEAYGWLKGQNVEIVGIAKEPVKEIAKNKQLFEIKYPLLSDESSKIAQQYFIKNNDFVAVVIDDKGMVQRVMKKSWAEEYLIELLLFFIKKDTSISKIPLTPDSLKNEILLTRANYSGYGNKYSNFDLPDEQGKWHRLSDCDGKWCVLFFPIDTSEECLDHMYYTSEIFDWLHNHDVEVMCVSTLEAEALARIKKRLHLKFLMLNDCHDFVGSVYGAYHWCGDTRMTLILNEKGKDMAIEEGGSPARHIMRVILFFMGKFAKKPIETS